MKIRDNGEWREVEQAWACDRYHKKVRYLTLFKKFFLLHETAGVFQSDDAVNWQSIRRPGIPDSTSYYDFTVLLKNRKMLLYLVTSRGVFRSDFTNPSNPAFYPVNTGLPGNGTSAISLMWSFAPDSQDQILLCGTALNNLCISHDLGDHWTVLNTIPPGALATSITVDGKGVIYGDGCLFESIDGQLNSWQIMKYPNGRNISDVKCYGRAGISLFVLNDSDELWVRVLADWPFQKKTSPYPMIPYTMSLIEPNSPLIAYMRDRGIFYANSWGGNALEWFDELNKDWLAKGYQGKLEPTCIAVNDWLYSPIKVSMVAEGATSRKVLYWR